MSDRDTLPIGTEIKGKRNGNRYHLVRLLGLGANGQVYLASSSGKRNCAIKIGIEATGLQGEVEILASLDHADKKRTPFLLDVDDGAVEGKAFPFYTMRFIPGTPVMTYLRNRGTHWMGVVGYRLLDRLAQLHEMGWVFGDVKNDNVLVSELGQVELVDYGGVSAMGQSVRQFTEIYDRGYWSAGSRIADQAYDCFAVAILWIHVLDGKRLTQLTKTLLPQNRHPRELMKLVRSNSKLKPLEGWMGKALSGKFENTRESSLAWKTAVRGTQKLVKSGQGVPNWMTGLLAASIVLCTFVAAVWLFK